MVAGILIVAGAPEFRLKTAPIGTEAQVMAEGQVSLLIAGGVTGGRNIAQGLFGGVLSDRAVPTGLRLAECRQGTSAPLALVCTALVDVLTVVWTGRQEMKRFVMAVCAATLIAGPAFAQASKCAAPPAPPTFDDVTEANVTSDKLKAIADTMVPGITAANAYGRCLSKEIARVNAQWAPAQKRYKALIAAYDKKYQPQNKTN